MNAAAPAPVALFAYNRPAHLLRVIRALAANPESAHSELHIYSDAARDVRSEAAVAEVRGIIATATATATAGFASVVPVLRERNLGLAGSIVDGVTRLCASHGRVIVVEDDLVVSRHFLRYMNDTLDMYEPDERVISIHAYIYPVSAPLPETFFLRGADCWGWATWKRGWDVFEPDGAKLLAQLEQRVLTRDFDFNGSADYTRMLRDQISGRNDSWAVRWYAAAFLEDRLTLYPGRSLVKNIGADGSGTHTGVTDVFDVRLTEDPVKATRIAIEESKAARALVEKYFRAIQPSMLHRLRNRARRLLRLEK